MKHFLIGLLLLVPTLAWSAGEASITVTCPISSSSSSAAIFPASAFSPGGSRRVAIFVATAAVSICSRPGDCVTGASGNTFTAPANVPIVDEYSRGQLYCISQAAATTLSVMIR